MRLLRRAVLEDARAGITKAFALLGNKLPGITMRRKRQLQHAVSIRVLHFAVGKRQSERVVAAAARAYHDLPDTMLRLGSPLRVLPRTPFLPTPLPPPRQI